MKFSEWCFKQNIIKDELLEIKDKYGDKRMSEMALHIPLDIEDEDLNSRRRCYYCNLIKVMLREWLLDEYKLQNRGELELHQLKCKTLDWAYSND